MEITSIDTNPQIHSISNNNILNIDSNNNQQEYQEWNETSSFSKTAGSISEGGTILNLLKKGFTFHQCLSELVANSIDANANTCLFDINLNSINIIDDGDGMNSVNLTSMFDLNRESHRDEQKIGICGVGAKASLLILSSKSWCNVFTYTKENQYLKASLNWEDIINQECWTGMISIIKMNETEIQQFKDERTKRHLNPFGTTIQIPYTNIVCKAIKDQFDIKIKIDPNILFPLRERLDIIYGYIPNFKIQLVCSDTPHQIDTMNVYSPFNLDDIYYYNGKTTHIIKVMKKDNTYDYVCNIDGEDKYIATTAKQTKNVLSPYNSKNCRGTQIGEFEFITGIYKDTKYFDPLNPDMPNRTDTDFNEYDKTMFGTGSDKTRKSQISQTPIIRNNHYIGGVPIKKFTTTDGGGLGQIKTTFNIWRTRHILKYYTNSSHDNDMDNIVNIQENKQQYNSFSFPPNLKRLLDKLIDIKCENIWTYFKELCERQALLNYDILTNINPSEYEHMNVYELRNYITELQNTEEDKKLQLYKHPILQNKTPERYNTLSLDELHRYIETENKKNNSQKIELSKNPILNDIPESQYNNIYLADELNNFIKTKEREEYNKRNELYKNPILNNKGCLSVYANLSSNELQKYIQELENQEKEECKKIIASNPIINNYPQNEWNHLKSKQLQQYINEKENITKMSNKKEELLKEKILEKYPYAEYGELSIEDLQNYITEKLHRDEIINENIDILHQFEPFEYNKLSSFQLSNFINSKKKIQLLKKDYKEILDKCLKEEYINLDDIQLKEFINKQHLIEKNKDILTNYGEENDYKNLNIHELEEYINTKKDIKLLLEENIDNLEQYDGYKIENYKNINITDLHSSIYDMNTYHELIDINKNKLDNYPKEKYKDLQQLTNLLNEINTKQNEDLKQNPILKRCPEHEWKHLKNDRPQLDIYIDTKEKELKLLDDFMEQKKQLYNDAKQQLPENLFLEFKRTKP